MNISLDVYLYSFEFSLPVHPVHLVQIIYGTCALVDNPDKLTPKNSSTLPSQMKPISHEKVIPSHKV